MEVLQTLEITNSDFKELDKFLKKNDLLDEKEMWFAGFPDHTRGAQNAIAANVFYGNRRLQIVTLKGDEIFFLMNSKKGLNVSKFGEVSEKYFVEVFHNLIYPSIRIVNSKDQTVHIQATKNKSMVKEFKKIFKNKK